MIKENPNCQNSEDDSTDAMRWDGATRSSVEVTVMVMERRGCVLPQFKMPTVKLSLDCLVYLKAA
jgi:hypothetical protein